MSIPNSLTTLRIVLTPVFVFLLLDDSILSKQISLAVYIVAALTDWYDGWIARKWGYSSRWGKFFDPLADKILSLSALFSFVALGLIKSWMVWIILVRDIVITSLRTYAELKDQPIVTSKTAQAKTFGEFIVIYYILFLYVGGTIPEIKVRYGDLISKLMDTQVLYGMMLLVTISTIGTGIIYLFDNRKLLYAIYGRYFGTSKAEE
jgi:CDP-diacylglycerol--glycerol-3-phosphate 3-phosphatidyltransferase